MIFHGSAREDPAPIPFVALPLARMFDRRTGKATFQDRAQLCSHFKISTDAGIILSGVDVDKAIEGWWLLERSQRVDLVRKLRSLGVALITSPNFSLFVDQPRWDDLHSIKRIAITHNEILDQGIRAALHVNGRTDADFQRWTDYLLERPEVDTLAYEFATGPGWVGRREMHVSWLCAMARAVNRPLSIVVRGGGELLPQLGQAFSEVHFIDTTSFMRTMKRRKAVITESGGLAWRRTLTLSGEPLDDLLNANIVTVGGWIRDQLPQMRLSA